MKRALAILVTILAACGFAGSANVVSVDGASSYSISEDGAFDEVSVIGSGTLSFTGTGKITAKVLDIAKGVTVKMDPNRLDAKKVTGDGVALYDGMVPTRNIGWAEDSWAGTVWIRNKSGITGDNAASTGVQFNTIGNEKSKVKLSGVSGWIEAPVIVNPEIVLDNELYDYALQLTNGCSPNDTYPDRCTTIKKLSGSGTLICGGTSAATPAVQVYDSSEFTGSINASATTGTGLIVIFCNESGTLPDTLRNMFIRTKLKRHIYVAQGYEVTVAPESKWSAENGILIDGELISKGLASFGNDTNINITENGVLSLIDTCNVDDIDVDYGRIEGDGVIKLKSESSWRALSTNNFPTALTLQNELSDGLFLRCPDVTYEIGSLNGSKGIRSDFGDEDRNLIINQSRDTEWSGVFQGSDHIGTVCVKGGASATGTITLSGQQTHNNMLLVEQSGAVNLTGDWIGSTNIVQGTFGGELGRLFGDLTFETGSTFKVVSTTRIAVSGCVACNGTVTVDVSEPLPSTCIVLLIAGELLHAENFVLAEGTPTNFALAVDGRSLILRCTSDVEATTLCNAKDATCTENGYSGDLVCDMCGERVLTGATIPALGHSRDEGEVTKEATQYEDGVLTYRCIRCGVVLDTVVIPALTPTWHVKSGVILTGVDLNGCTDITIPEYVVRIESRAFDGCYGISITIPDSVTSVEDHAFDDCIINELTLPKSFWEGGSYYDTDFLRYTRAITLKIADGTEYVYNYRSNEIRNFSFSKLFIPDSVVEIKERAFENCRSLREVTFGRGVKKVGLRAFYGCNNLESVYISDLSAWCGIEFGNGRYDNNYYTNPLSAARARLYLNGELVRDLVIPDDVTNVGTAAFYGCDSVTNITIGSSVTNIGAYAFYGCSIWDLVVPTNVIDVAEGAFGCQRLRNVTIPQCLCQNDASYNSYNYRYDSRVSKFNSVFGIGKYYSYGSITNIVIAQGVTNIGYRMFAELSSLESVTIPPSLVSVGKEAFYGCDRLERVYISDLGAWCEIEFNADNETYSYSYDDDYVGSNPLAYASEGLYLNGSPVVALSDDLVIPDSITRIWDWAFSNCRSIKSVTIPDSVTSIGDNAFSGCQSITNITMPNTVKNIGRSAFYGCYRLKSVVIPNSVTNIGSEAFGYCRNLESVTIPQYLCESDGYGYHTRFDDVFGRDYSYHLLSLIIAEGVTNIAENAFYRSESLSYLTSITIPSSVRSIGRHAFPASSSVRVVNISDLAAWCAINLADVTSNPFCGSYYGGGRLVLNGVLISGNLEIPDGVTSIGRYTFAFLDGITSVTIPHSVTHIGSRAFYCTYPLWWGVYISDLSAWCKIDFEDFDSNPLLVGEGKLYLNGKELQGRLVIPNDVNSIGPGAFYNCSGLTEIFIGDATTKIGDWAFRGCSGLVSIEVGDGNETYKSENGVLLSKDGKTLLQGVNGNVTIPDSVANIASYAFYGCTNLTGVAMSDSVVSIGSYAFYGCGSLESVTIPEGVESIGNRAFGNCNKLKSFSVAEGNATYKSEAGLLLSKDGKILLSGVNGNVVIPEGVVSIANEAFYSCKGLTSLIMPDSLTTIGDRPFYGCQGLSNLLIGNGVTNIGTYSFYWCSGLMDVAIPDSVTNISSYAFYGCSSLTNLTIGNGVANIGDYSFSGCTNLSSVAIPGTVEIIGNRAFYNCSGLTSLIIDNGVAKIGDSSFSGCKSLVSVAIPGTVEIIGNSAFYECSGLISLTINNGVVNIRDSSFYGCSGLSSVAIPDSVTSIGNCAFYRCNNLAGLTIGNSVTNIGYSAFYGSTNLTNVAIGRAVQKIDWSAFSDCKLLGGVRFNGDAPDASSAFSSVKSGCVAYVRRDASGFPAEGEKWNNLIVKYYGGEVETGTMTELEDGGYVVVANEGETLTDGNIAFTAVAGGVLVDTTKGYDIKISADGQSATVSLKAPMIALAPNEEAEKDESDQAGVLVDATTVQLATTPITNKDETVGALPVDAVPGLYYQASWGDDLGSMTTGSKVQATGDSLYLGVIKQKGPKGFYRLTVSEQ